MKIKINSPTHIEVNAILKSIRNFTLRCGCGWFGGGGGAGGGGGKKKPTPPLFFLGPFFKKKKKQ